MTRIERLGRLLELVIPGGKEPAPGGLAHPCEPCDQRTPSGYTCPRRYSDLGGCSDYKEYSGKIDEIDKQWKYVHYEYMRSAVQRFHIRHHLKQMRSIYIPYNEEVETILTLFRRYNRWRKLTDPIVPMLYKGSGATWNAIKVALAMSGIGRNKM